VFHDLAGYMGEGQRLASCKIAGVVLPRSERH
jgi:hypothetical protein